MKQIKIMATLIIVLVAIAYALSAFMNNDDANAKKQAQQEASKKLHKEMTIDHDSGRDWSKLYE
ncbi:hypothetical protein KFZ68_20670 (plasmid) [Photobacterium damselae]|uniref:hypothetical protein n=1 Tax=Photobacterium damselae TaxID=38293 RepID=UPI002542BC70